MERDPFKIRVRRLKDLGLTESLDVGYRISPRGAAAVLGPIAGADAGIVRLAPWTIDSTDTSPR